MKLMQIFALCIITMVSQTASKVIASTLTGSSLVVYFVSYSVLLASDLFLLSIPVAGNGH